MTEKPTIGEIVTYLRKGRVRRHSGYVNAIAPEPVKAFKVTPTHPQWTEIWVSLDEINAARKDDNAN